MTRSVPFFRPYFPDEKREKIGNAVAEILKTGTLMMGPWKDRFEAAFSELCGTPHALSVNSATTALQIGLQYAGVRGREVLVPAGSFVTDISAIYFAGGTPVLVDMNPATLSFDLEDLAAKMTANTAAVIWVHLTGIISPEYQAIRQFAKDHELFLIEDASHAHGAEIDGHSAGSLGDMGVFSFYPTKLITTGTGGMLTTGSSDLAAYTERLRLFGKDPKSGDIVDLGNDWFLDEMRCCVGWHGISDLPKQLERRRAIAKRYTVSLRNAVGLTLLDPCEGQRPAWYHYTALTTSSIDRDRLGKTLHTDYWISTKQIYKPTHFEPVFKDLDTGGFGATETTLARSLCLPMFVDLKDDEVDYVTDALITELKRVSQV